MIEYNQLVEDIKQLSIQEGDVVFIRLSMHAIGKVEGGADTVIDALLEVLGPNGTLVATAFPLRQKELLHTIRKKVVYKPGMKPSTGIIPVMMSRRPNAFFSSNPITPFVAIGGDAKAITAMHTPETEPYSLIENIVKNYHAKCLRVGGNVLVGTTHLSFTAALKSIDAYQKRIGEGMYYYDDEGNLNWKSKDVSCFCYNSYREFYNLYLKEHTVLTEGRLGEGHAVVTDMLRTYEIEKEKLIGNPQLLQCNDEDCLTCRCSYSYSEVNILSYILKEVFSKEPESKDRVKDAIELLLLGKKCR